MSLRGQEQHVPYKNYTQEMKDSLEATNKSNMPFFSLSYRLVNNVLLLFKWLFTGFTPLDRKLFTGVQV